jgi:hypothetical protein
MRFEATRLIEGPGLELVPAEVARTWMDETDFRFAYRCLPLSMANQAGWVVPCPLDLEATWDGQAIHFRALDPEAGRRWAPWIGERAGLGILAFRLPYRFRTAPGYGLLVRGPTNGGLPGAAALDLFLDTAAAPAHLSADWRLLEAGRPVHFPAGFPLCHLLPYPLDLLEATTPCVRPIEDAPELHDAFRRWADSRISFNRDTTRPETAWQKDYFQGKTTDGERAPTHRTRLHLRPFAAEGET